MSVTDEYCTHCGQSMGYRSAMSKGVVKTLEVFADAVEKKGENAINMKKELVEEGLITVTQFGNRSHMEKLGLIAHLEVSNYCLTRKGMAFLQGEPVPREVVVKKSTRGKGTGSKTVEASTETCTIHDFMEKGEYWIVPGFEIREGRVIHLGANQHRMP